MIIQEAINYVNYYIKTNGSRKITGEKMNVALNNILAAVTLENVRDQTIGDGKMGYKVLQPDATFANQMTDANIIYEIRDVFDLESATFNLPDNIVLRFNGGRLKNGTLSTSNTTIDADNVQIFDNVQLSGTSLVNEVLIPEWFGAVGDGTTDCTSVFKSILAVSSSTRVPVYMGNNRIYYITDSLFESGEHRIRIRGEERQTSHIYSSQNGFKVLKGISLFKDCILHGYITNVAFIGTDRTGAAIVFDTCTINRFRIDKCLMSQFEAVFYNTSLQACRIHNSRFLTCYYFSKVDGVIKEVWDTIISGNYINGGEEKTDNNAFEWSSYNGTIITNNFIDFYRVIYYPKGVTNHQGINSCSNQYQVFRYFYYSDLSRKFCINSKNDIFNWITPSSLQHLQDYTPIQYVAHDANTYNLPPYIALCNETFEVDIKGAVLEKNIPSSLVFIFKSLTTYAYGAFNVEFDSKQNVSSVSSQIYDYSVADGVNPIYNSGNYKGNAVNMPNFIKNVDSLPSFTSGWCGMINGCYVKKNGTVYQAKNIYNALDDSYTPTWVRISECKNNGDTASRPKGLGATGGVLVNSDIGFRYFDTTLGKPIFASAIAADGTVTWVDADGNNV